MELFKLLGTIAIDNGDAISAISETSESASSLSEKMVDVGSSISDTGRMMTATVTKGAYEAGNAILDFANSSAAAADNVDKMSQKIGISRQSYQELDFICSQSGTSVDSLQMGMKTLVSAMDGASSGTASNVEQFDKLGISVTDANGNLRSQEDVMWETMSALQGMENQTEKSRLATELFGRSGTELMPLLNGASGSIEDMKKQAQDLGLVLSDEAIDSGVQYTDKMDQLQRSFQAVALECGDSLLPIITELGQWMIDEGLPAFQEFMDKVSGLIEWFKGLDDGTKATIAIIAGLVVAIGPVLTIVGNLITIGGILAGVIGAISAPVLLVVAAIAAVIAIGVALYKNWDTIKEKAGELGESIKGKWDDLKSATAEKFESVKQTISDAMSSAKQKATESLTAMKKAYDENGGGIKGSMAATMEGIKQSMSTTYDALNKSTNGKFGDIANTISTKLNSAKDTVRNAIDKIKGFFDFKWELPKLKMPHFKASGKFSLNPLSVPSFGIDWYKDGGILDKATVLGFNASTGNAQVAGEAGKEAVLPLSDFYAHLESIMKNQASGNVSVNVNIDHFENSSNQSINEIVDAVQNAISIQVNKKKGAFA